MGEIVNLRRARKAKKRAGAEIKAAENRARFGRAKGERAAVEMNEAQRLARLDGHRRDLPSPDES